MTPKEYYEKQLASGEIIADPQQLAIVDKLEALYQSLMQDRRPRLLKLFTQRSPNKGLYLWGNVGAGKTFLMNSFYFCLPFDEKLRIHFHQFMDSVHLRLKDLQGYKNPLQIIAKELASRYKIICFDELNVTDIADAMLLGELLHALFNQSMRFVFTSNSSPDDLYKKGLQRQRFLPAIELIKKQTEQVHIEIQQDYRLQPGAKLVHHLFSKDKTTLPRLEFFFNELTQPAPASSEPLNIHERKIRVKKYADGVVWFDFMDLCGIPRSQKDYLSLIQKFHTFIISDMPVIGPTQTDLAREFINLIDVLYDARIKLIIATEVGIDELYPKGKLTGEFVRTRSRLHEMTRM